MSVLSAFRSLRERNARVYLGGIFVSNVGTWAQATATTLLVKRLADDRHEGTMLGIALALQFLPMLLLGAWAGAFADQRNKRRLTIVTQAGLMGQAVALAVLDAVGAAKIPVVFALALVLGVVNAFDNPARRGVITELVHPDEIPNVVALNTAVMTGSRVFGPALAAWMVTAFGTAWCFAANAVSFLAVLASLLAMNVSALHVSKPAVRGGTPVRDGLRFVWNHQRLRVTFVVLAVVSTFAFNYSVALPLIADRRFGDETLFGPLLSVLSAGSVVGSLTVASRRTVGMRWLLAAVVGTGVSGLAFSWAPNRIVAFIAIVPVGFFGAMYVAAANVISQTMCPPEMRSRLLALTAVAFLGSTPIGGPITGLIGDSVSAEWSLAYGSVIALATVVWAVLSLRRYDSRPNIAGAQSVASG